MKTKKIEIKHKNTKNSLKTQKKSKISLEQKEIINKLNLTSWSSTSRIRPE